MKANEFVKNCGIDSAKDILKNKRSWIDKKSGRKLTDNSFVLKSKTYEYAIGTLYMGNFSDYDENSYRVDEVNLLLLKRLVESHDYIKSLGGISFVKDNLPLGYFGDGNYKELIQECLEDVESCL